MTLPLALRMTTLLQHSLGLWSKLIRHSGRRFISSNPLQYRSFAPVTKRRDLDGRDVVKPAIAL